MLAVLKKEFMNNLPEGCTNKLSDINSDKSQETFHLFKKYMINHSGFSHPAKKDLDYRLTVINSKMIITRSDKPVVPLNERAKLSAKFSKPDKKLVRKTGQHGSTGTATYEISDKFLEDLDGPELVGFSRIILKRNIIETVLNQYMKARQQAVIYWFSYADSLQGKSLEQLELYKDFEARYAEQMEFLTTGDPSTLDKCLNSSIEKLIKKIIWYQG